MTSESFCIISFSADIFLSKYSIRKHSIFIELVFVEISNKYSAKYFKIIAPILEVLLSFCYNRINLQQYSFFLRFAFIWHHILIKHTQKIWQTTVAPDGTSVARALSCGARGAVLAPVFCKTKKNLLIKRMGNSMKQKLLFGFILIIILLKRFQIFFFSFMARPFPPPS